MNSESNRRTTQADVARIAGVHRSTVSLALKRHPNISRKTCDRIQKIAEELGYSPDPMLSALAFYRNQNRESSYQGTLAWLVKDTPDFRWEDKIYRIFFLSAQARAKIYGYGIEIFDLNEKGLSARRLAQILRTRNIQGILVCPQPEPRSELVFPWEDFSAVTFGFSLLRPQLHTVAAAHYTASVTVVKKLRAKGHSRIGFMAIHDDRANNSFVAGYLSEMFMEDRAIRIPPLHPSECDNEGVLRWFEKYRPTAVIGPPDVDIRVKNAGISLDEVTLACAFVPNGQWPISGVYEDADQIGQVATDILVSMIQQGERGVPSSPRRTMVEGKWLDRD